MSTNIDPIKWVNLDQSPNIDPHENKAIHSIMALH